MSSTFEWAAKNVVRELSKKGELIPVDSLKSSTCFSPYYLVRKKIKSTWFWKSRYAWLNLTLEDILEPGSPKLEVTQGETFLFNDEMDGQVSGSVEVAASVQGKISGQTSVSNKSCLEVKILTVPPTTWDCLNMKRKLKKSQPSKFKELQTRGENLYVVTEAVQTQKEAVLKRSKNRQGSGKITIPGASCIQGEGTGQLNTMKTVKIPEGSILAFQVVKLIIRDRWSVVQIPDKTQKTFQNAGIAAKSSGYYSDACKTVTVSSVKSLEQLQAQLEDEEKVLDMLNVELRMFLLKNFLEVLKNEQDLLDFEDMLENSLYTGVTPKDVNGPSGNLLSHLQDSDGKLLNELSGAFLYLTGALNALSDVQHQALIKIQSLEKEEKEKIMSQEIQLVEEILKKNFDQTEETTFSYPSELVSLVQGQSDMSIRTRELLEECGLWFSEDKAQLTWDPCALHSLCALYGSLMILQFLTNA
ncbi:gasdermin-D [Monodelphis domestica]|uniref:Gasdermin D n=1 Tax=Monodelphis domestica TaxID=13616 RepID=F6WZ33_MONDO|nr:gasdermin-D [Monodelphis domestica]XP_007488898.1 gasdermin-D [Monodelphis domestica]